MKNLLSLLLISLLGITALQAQDEKTMSSEPGKAYEAKDLDIQLGTSFGFYDYGYGLGTRSFTLPLTVSGEYGINDKFSVGAFLGYARWSYNYLSGSDYSYTFISYGVRGSFHYVPLLNEAFDFSIDEQKIDLYVTLMIGAENRTFRYDGNDTGALNLDDDNQGIFSPVLGARYLFNKNIGVFLEAGRGVYGYSTFGLLLKL